MNCYCVILVQKVEVIMHRGYPAETHLVTTEDGYIIEVHRIPHGKQVADSSERKRALFLQHCLLCSSAVWVLNPTEKSLGMVALTLYCKRCLINLPT